MPTKPIICTLSGCSRPWKARGLCNLHYTRWLRHGDVNHKRGRPPQNCVVAGCSVVARRAGMCERHYAAQPRQLLTLVWRNMVRRCSDVKDRRYPAYGGRGITVCDRWQGRDGCKNFLIDIGPRPPEPEGWVGKRSYWSIDRIDNDGPYSPENCRWASHSEQERNKRLPLRLNS